MIDENRYFLAINHIKSFENALLTIKYRVHNTLGSLLYLLKNRNNIHFLFDELYILIYFIFRLSFSDKIDINLILIS